MTYWDIQIGVILDCLLLAVAFRRKITVFSATLAAFTIDHGESESSGPDLLVSFHDNDHYNSVHNNDAAPKPSVKRKARSINKAEPNSTDESENKTEPSTRVEDLKTSVIEKSDATVNENSDTTMSTADASMSELSVDDKDGADEKQKSTKRPRKARRVLAGVGWGTKSVVMPKINMRHEWRKWTEKTTRMANVPWKKTVKNKMSPWKAIFEFYKYDLRKRLKSSVQAVSGVKIFLNWQWYMGYLHDFCKHGFLLQLRVQLRVLLEEASMARFELAFFWLLLYVCSR
jgi:hypothetical protein